MFEKPIFAVFGSLKLISARVKQLGSGRDTELLVVTSRSKLFAYGTTVVRGGLRVTVLVLIKLTKIAVALRLRCGSCKLIF